MDVNNMDVLLIFNFSFQLTLFPLKDGTGSPELPFIPNGQHAMLYNPEAVL